MSGLPFSLNEHAITMPVAKASNCSPIFGSRSLAADACIMRPSLYRDIAPNFFIAANFPNKSNSCSVRWAGNMISIVANRSPKTFFLPKTGIPSPRSRSTLPFGVSGVITTLTEPLSVFTRVFPPNTAVYNSTGKSRYRSFPFL